MGVVMYFNLGGKGFEDGRLDLYRGGDVFQFGGEGRDDLFQFGTRGVKNVSACHPLPFFSGIEPAFNLYTEGLHLYRTPPPRHALSPISTTFTPPRDFKRNNPIFLFPPHLLLQTLQPTFSLKHWRNWTIQCFWLSLPTLIFLCSASFRIVSLNGRLFGTPGSFLLAAI